MELGAQRKDEERREKAEVTEELKGFMMQGMTRGFSIFEEVVSFLRHRPLEEGMATHSSILAGRTPWTEEPCGLQTLGSQRVENN